MKYLISIISLIFLGMHHSAAAEKSLLARVTVYWNSVKSEEHACWNGARLRSGHCAVDPNKIPYGSKVVFPDLACLAVDTGPDVVNRKAARSCARTVLERSAIVVDRFFETKAEALAWVGTHPHFMTLRILAAESKKGGKDAALAGGSHAEEETRISRTSEICMILDGPAS